MEFVWHWSAVHHFQNPRWTSCCHLFHIWWRSSGFVACLFFIMPFFESMGSGTKEKKVCNCQQFRRRREWKKIDTFICYYCKGRYSVFSLACWGGKIGQVWILCSIPHWLSGFLFDSENKSPGLSRRLNPGKAKDKRITPKFRLHSFISSSVTNSKSYVQRCNVLLLSPFGLTFAFTK